MHRSEARYGWLGVALWLSAAGGCGSGKESDADGVVTNDGGSEDDGSATDDDGSVEDSGQNEDGSSPGEPDSGSFTDGGPHDGGPLPDDSSIAPDGMVDVDAAALCEANPVAACGDGATDCYAVGSDYECECGGGYSASNDFHACLDIDECKAPTRCGDNAIACQNLAGDYECKCAPGAVQSSNKHSCLLGLWASPEVLDHGWPIDLAVNGKGEAMLVFRDEAGGLFARRYAPARGWEAASRLTMGQPAGEARVAMDEAGNAFALWFAPGSLPFDALAWGAFHEAGHGWRAPAKISDVVFSGTAYPQLAMVGTSGLAVFALNAVNDALYTGDFDASRGFSALNPLDEYATVYGDPSLAFNRSGDGVLAWIVPTDLGALHVSRYQGGAWGSVQELLVAQTQSELMHPATAINEAGVSMVAVASESGGALFTMATRAAGFPALTPIATVAPLSLHMHVDTAGRALAIWDRFDLNVEVEVMATAYDGHTWSPPVMISKGEGHALEPVLAGNGAGLATMGWAVTGGATWANRYDPQTGWLGIKRLDDKGDSRDSLLLGMDDGGNTIAVWQAGLFTHEIMASRF